MPMTSARAVRGAVASAAHPPTDGFQRGPAPTALPGLRELTQHGVPAARLTARGYGKTQPAYPNDTPANRAKNRRIQITVESP